MECWCNCKSFCLTLPLSCIISKIVLNDDGVEPTLICLTEGALANMMSATVPLIPVESGTDPLVEVIDEELGSCMKQTGIYTVSLWDIVLLHAPPRLLWWLDPITEGEYDDGWLIWLCCFMFLQVSFISEPLVTFFAFLWFFIKQLNGFFAC